MSATSARTESSPSSANTPVFVIGSGRSGTTLLYHMVLTSGDFPMYMAESKILECPGHYGPLTSERNRAQFLEDFVSSRQFARSGLDEEEFIAEAHSRCRDYVEFLRFFMDSMALDQGKARWVEKTPLHAYHVDRLARRFPSSKFVHIVRDGRDVALSLRSLGWTPECFGDGRLQLVAAAEQWEDVVTAAHEAGTSLDGRYLVVSFESLLGDTEAELARLAEFCETSLSLDRIRQAEFGSLGKANTAFEDRGDAASPRPVERWKRQMTEEEIAVLAATIGPTLRKFGYDLTGAGLPTTKSAAFSAAAAGLDAYRRLREFARTRTPLGRLVGSPLELGLD